MTTIKSVAEELDCKIIAIEVVETKDKLRLSCKEEIKDFENEKISNSLDNIKNFAKSYHEYESTILIDARTDNKRTGFCIFISAFDRTTAFMYDPVEPFWGTLCSESKLNIEKDGFDIDTFKKAIIEFKCECTEITESNIETAKLFLQGEQPIIEEENKED